MVAWRISTIETSCLYKEGSGAICFCKFCNSFDRKLSQILCRGRREKTFAFFVCTVEGTERKWVKKNECVQYLCIHTNGEHVQSWREEKDDVDLIYLFNQSTQWSSRDI